MSRAWDPRTCSSTGPIVHNSFYFSTREREGSGDVIRYHYKGRAGDDYRQYRIACFNLRIQTGAILFVGLQQCPLPKNMNAAKLQ